MTTADRPSKVHVRWEATVHVLPERRLLAYFQQVGDLVLDDCDLREPEVDGSVSATVVFENPEDAARAVAIRIHHIPVRNASDTNVVKAIVSWHDSRPLGQTGGCTGAWAGRPGGTQHPAPIQHHPPTQQSAPTQQPPPTGQPAPDDAFCMVNPDGSEYNLSTTETGTPYGVNMELANQSTSFVADLLQQMSLQAGPTPGAPGTAPGTFGQFTTPTRNQPHGMNYGAGIWSPQAPGHMSGNLGGSMLRYPNALYGPQPLQNNQWPCMGAQAMPQNHPDMPPPPGYTEAVYTGAHQNIHGTGTPGMSHSFMKSPGGQQSDMSLDERRDNFPSQLIEEHGEASVVIPVKNIGQLNNEAILLYFSQKSRGNVVESGCSFDREKGTGTITISNVQVANSLVAQRYHDIRGCIVELCRPRKEAPKVLDKKRLVLKAEKELTDVPPETLLAYIKNRAGKKKKVPTATLR